MRRRIRLSSSLGVLLAGYQPVLQVLQKMSRTSELPFSEWLATDAAAGRPPRMPPPKYALMPGFRFDFSGIMRDNAPVTYALGEKLDKSRCQLDESQADALVDCLHRSLALIQGPPGTGKSFTSVALMKVLLAVQVQAGLGPIICVCYTNHALDQLLESLIKQGVQHIIRLGSRSQSEILQKRNLRIVARSMPSTSGEKKHIWEMKQLLRIQQSEINTTLASFSTRDNEKTIQAYLKSHHRAHYSQLFATSMNAYDKVDPDRGDQVRTWLRGGPRQASIGHPRSVDDLLHSDLFTMASGERQSLHQHWTADIWHILHEQAIQSIQSHQQTKEQYDRIRAGQDLKCLSKACIVGVTTTGSARHRDLLRGLGSKVLICEEAGEVVEAHVLTTLLPSLQHVILVGDHLQLRPHIQNHKLSRENPEGVQYSLDLSLFERLVNPHGACHEGLRPKILQIQRRMHSSISDLIRTPLYPHLKDSARVDAYPAVAGMKKRLFWLDHREQETRSVSEQIVHTSYSNYFEARMVVALVSHLVRQAVYQQGDIAVLTPYLGQQVMIRKLLQHSSAVTLTKGDAETIRNTAPPTDAQSQSPRPAGRSHMLKTVRVATVDNFQGEEAKVVIISLVRSNDDYQCGFLQTSNRINVLLSRAKHGMYIIGDSSTFGKVKMWAGVISTLQTSNNLGTQLELRCPRHPNSPIWVSKPEDFKAQAPGGGCNRPCGRRLHCGHTCVNKCHSQVLHSVLQCQRKVRLSDCAMTLPGAARTASLACWQVHHLTSIGHGDWK